MLEISTITDDEENGENQIADTPLDENADQNTDEPKSIDDESTEDTEESVVITIGDEQTSQEDSEPAPAWVKELRKTNREDKRRIRELQEQLNAAKSAETKPAETGAKPTLDAYDYDTELYEAELSKWFDRKRESDLAADKARQAEQASQQAWQSKLSDYGKAKAALRVQDYEDAEAMAEDALSVTQQGIILQGAENPAIVIYALGKNPKKAAELAAINDPVRFAFSIAKLESELKVTKRKPAVEPESKITTSGRPSGSIDSTLNKLRAEAEKTGDLSKVLQYKKQLKAK